MTPTEGCSLLHHRQRIDWIKLRLFIIFSTKKRMLFHFVKDFLLPMFIYASTCQASLPPSPPPPNTIFTFRSMIDRATRNGWSSDKRKRQLSDERNGRSNDEKTGNRTTRKWTIKRREMDDQTTRNVPPLTNNIIHRLTTTLRINSM